jgi:hypothetical protein
MPKLKRKWNDIDESTGGFSDVEPGAYSLVITGYEPHEDKEFVRLTWDVADGPAKGTYAQSQYPPTDVVSWKESAYGMLKHKLHVLADCNPGFQPTVSFESDQWQDFVGKRFYAVVRRRLYTAGPRSKTPGADKAAIEVARWLKPEEYESGDWPRTLLEDRDQRDQTQQAPQAAQVPQGFGQQPDVYDEDVPF